MISATQGSVSWKPPRRPAIVWLTQPRTCNSCALSKSSYVPDIDVPERHRTVVALQHDGIRRGFRDLHVAHCRFRNFYILLYDIAIQQHAQYLSVRCLLTACLELWRSKPDVQ